MSIRPRRKTSPSELVKIFQELFDLIEKYGAQIKTFTENQYHNLKLKFDGKSIAVIGPKQAGKTTFVNILKNPNYEVDTMNYTPTQGFESFKSTSIRYKIPLSKDKKVQSITFKLKKPKDVGGEESYRDNGEWADVCKESDFLFYIFDSFEHSQNMKMQDRIIQDLKWIADNNQLFAQSFGIIIFVNKIDRFSSKEYYDKWISDNLSKFEKDVRKALNGFEEHLLLISPISMQSKSTRANVISSALLKVTERK